MSSFPEETPRNEQIPAKRGPNLKFVAEANYKPLLPKIMCSYLTTNGLIPRLTEMFVQQGRSIRPRSEYRITFGQISNNVQPFLIYYMKQPIQS